MSVASRVVENVRSGMELERNPGKLSDAGGRGGRPEFVDAVDEGGVWRSAAYWARKDRGVRLRNAQRLTGDLVDGEVVGAVGAPWIASLLGRHGLYSTYVNWECRCGECCGAHEEYGSDYRMGVSPDS